jgi:hypothetical protein
LHAGADLVHCAVGPAVHDTKDARSLQTFLHHLDVPRLEEVQREGGAWELHKIRDEQREVRAHSRQFVFLKGLLRAREELLG